MNFSQYSGIFVFVLLFHKRYNGVRNEKCTPPCPLLAFPFLISKCPSENVGNDISTPQL